ncbi:MAG: DNA primase [Candidatus Aenigmarchaeota archaeon]|nr:DNA primase [Candidatus Aenigmarchaeota archaeon]
MFIMAKLAQSTIKYLIEADFSADGVVEKPDVIGAIFGQTEGLLGQDLDLRELQRTGRIGRIEVNLIGNKGKTSGKISIPSSLDSSETSLIAASIETIERIGPCDSYIKVIAVKDIRSVKRDYVVDRAKRILRKLLEEEIPNTIEITEKIKESVRTAEIRSYKGLPAGPELLTSDEIIIVEGRADVITLLKNGIKNTVAMGGATIPKTIVGLCKEKTTTVFLDGDRGGDLILKELLQLTSIDYIARAPDGKEVEELTKKEIFKSLRERTPTGQLVSEAKRDLDEKIKKKLNSILEKMVGTRAAYIFDEKMKLKYKIPLKQFKEDNEKIKEAEIVVADGDIDEDLVHVAETCNVKYLIGNKKDAEYKTRLLTIYTKDNLIIE